MLKIHVNRLSHDELNYELLIRGIATGNVEEMRHELTMALRLEKSGDGIKYPPYRFTVNEEVKAVDDKLKILQPLIDSFKDTASSSAYLKFISKLNHILNRNDNIPETAADRPRLLSRALLLIDQLLTKAEDAEKELAVLVQMSLIGANQAQISFAATIPPRCTSNPVWNSGPSSSLIKSVPPLKWN